MTRPAKNRTSRFDHDRMEIELEVTEEDSFQDAVQQAKTLCLIGLGHISEEKIKEAKTILEQIDYFEKFK